MTTRGRARIATSRGRARLCPRVSVATLVVLTGLLAGCASSKRADVQSDSLDPDALYKTAIEALESGNARVAKINLERIQYTPQVRTTLEPLVRLALADVAFETGDDISLIDARSKYLDFVTLYGDHPRAPYAQLQAGVCSILRAAHPTKDQTQTLVAITDFKEVQRRYPASPYARAAADRLVEAENRLAEHDFAVGRFYYKRKSYFAAAERFRGVLQRYPRFGGKEKVYYYLGEALVRTNNSTEGRLYLEKLLTDYPHGEYAEDARRSLARLPSGDAADANPVQKG